MWSKVFEVDFELDKKWVCGLRFFEVFRWAWVKSEPGENKKELEKSEKL